MAAGLVEAWATKACRGLFSPEEVKGTVLAYLLPEFAGEALPTEPHAVRDLAMMAAETAISKVTEDVRWDAVAARIVIGWLHDHVGDDWQKAVQAMRAHTAADGSAMSLIAHKVHRMAFFQCGAHLKNTMDHSRDDRFTYVATKMLIKQYLLKDIKTGLPLETPQMAYMRAACAICPESEMDVVELYHLFSTGRLSLPSPALATLGTNNERPSSCFLSRMLGDGDSIVSIFDTLKLAAIVSRDGGGFGWAVSSIRASGSAIKGNLGNSNGLIPWLRQFNEMAKAVDQGGRRPAALAAYLEPWHDDIFDFIDLRLTTGNEDRRCHDLNTALWIPDLLMERAKAGESWSLFCPNELKNAYPEDKPLYEVWGDAFVALYTKYEGDGVVRRTVPAREIIERAAASLEDNGEPYIMYKDTVNRLDMQSVGTITNSNLCVSGTTELLTRYGPVRIGTLVPDSGVKSPIDEDRERYKVRIAELEEVVPEVIDVEDFEMQKQSDVLEGLKQALSDLPPERPPVTKAEEVEIWTGDTWAKTVPKRTGKKKKLLRITTSHGVRIDCTPEHEWVLVSGKKVPATELAMGTELVYTRPVMYEPAEPHRLEISERDSFFLGVVYGFALRQQGRQMTDQVKLRVKADVLMLRRAAVTEKALEILGYDKATAKKEPRFAEIDHDTIVVIDIPNRFSQMRTIPSASIANRQTWCAGFIVAVEQNFMMARSCWRVLHPVLSMFRSTGEHLKMIPMGNNDTWIIVPVRLDAENKDVPVITGLQDLNEIADTYCVSTEYGKATFNLQLTGNCTEIHQRSTKDEVAVCTLSALALDKYVTDDRAFDFKALHADAKVAVKRLDRMLDLANYADPRMAKGVARHRDIGVGVMGYHSALIMMRIPMHDGTGTNPEALRITSNISECILHACVEATCELARDFGPHPSFFSTQASRGKVCFDLLRPTEADVPLMYTDWDEKRRECTEGRRNGLLNCSMPTASTSLVNGSSEGRNPNLSNVHKVTNKTGEFPIVNKLLIEYLRDEGKLSPDVVKAIVDNGGSVRGLGLGRECELLFATAWEIPNSTVIDLTAAWARFVEQGNSMNVQLEAPDPVKIQRIIFYAWEKQLKTGIYYLRTRPAFKAIAMDRGAAPAAAAAAAAAEPAAAAPGCASGACAM